MRKNTLQIERRIELENMVRDLKNNPEIDTSDDFLGIIKIDEKYRGKRFALTHEIVRYIIGVGVGNKVEETYVRNTENNTKFGWFWKRA